MAVCTAFCYAIALVAADISMGAFAIYFPATLIATLIGGWLAGAFALTTGMLFARWTFMSPAHSFMLVSSQQIAIVLASVLSGLLILILAEFHRRLAHRSYENERANQLVIDELNHRLRNKIATVQAMLGFELSDTEVLDTISGRLDAITKTDELIVRSSGQGAELGELLRSELSVYGAAALSRIEARGPAIMLPPGLALALALILHELTTNAVKHGGLSVPDGNIRIFWSIRNERVEMSWTERDGPPAHPPERSGFGTALFRRALEPFQGGIVSHFEPDGLACDINFALPPEYAGRALSNGRVHPTG